VPGDTGRPLGVRPSHVQVSASSASGSSSTRRADPGDVLKSMTRVRRPGACRRTRATPPPGTGSNSGRGARSATGPIDSTRGRGGVVSSRTDCGTMTLRPCSWSVMR
jgi:hypothetical protein